MTQPPRLSQHPHLTFADRDAETSELFRRLAAAVHPHESQQVVDQLVHLYLDVCSTMAGRYDGRSIEHDDLVQVARLALVKAIRRYEPGHAPSFAAYAVPMISGELRRWLRDRGWVVRPTDDERPGLTRFPVTEDRELVGADDRVCLADALTELDDDERELLLRRYVAGMTQRDIGEVQGAGQTQVSCTVPRITVHLHDHLAEQVEPSPEMSTAFSSNAPSRQEPARSVRGGLPPALAPERRQGAGLGHLAGDLVELAVGVLAGQPQQPEGLLT